LIFVILSSPTYSINFEGKRTGRRKNDSGNNKQLKISFDRAKKSVKIQK